MSRDDDDAPRETDAVGHYRTLLDHEFLGAWDLTRDGKAAEATFTIGAVRLVPVVDPTSGKKAPRLCITPRGRDDRKLVLGKTNSDLIAALHGPQAEGWVGKQITIYPAQTKFGRDKVDCIRVRVPDELLRTSPMIRTRVRKKLLAEIGWSAVQPKTREERGMVAPSREPGED